MPRSLDVVAGPGQRVPYRTRPVGLSDYADARLALGLTQRQVAAKIGSTVSVIKRLEREAQPPVGLAYRLAVRYVLGMPRES